MRARKWTKDELKKAITTSYSYRQVLSKIRLREAGGNYTQLKRYIKEFNFDTKHFKGQAWNKGFRGIGKPRIPTQKILVRDSDFQSYKLKRRLFREHLKPQCCEKCGWAQKTVDGYLPLELHHLNGDRRDNRLENLRILCPNCHSLEPTYRARKLKKSNGRVAER